jgi:hypothetical protein
VFRSFRKFAESSAEGLKSEIAAAIAGSPPEHSSEISEFSLRFDCAEDEEEELDEDADPDPPDVMESNDAETPAENDDADESDEEDDSDVNVMMSLTVPP